jgi:hypothetical protein
LEDLDAYVEINSAWETTEGISKLQPPERAWFIFN